MIRRNRELGDKLTVFSPGPVIGGEPVTRTFQPSFTVLQDGTIVALCQGRFGHDDDPKQLLMSRSHDGGATWEDARALTAPLTHFAISAYTRQTPEKREVISALILVDMCRTKQYYNGDEALIRERTGINLAEVGRQTPMVLCRFDSDDGGGTWSMEALCGNRTPLGQTIDGWTVTMANPIGQVHVIPEGSHRNRMILSAPVTAVPPGEPISEDFRDYPQVGSGLMVSDDDGETWQLTGMTRDYLTNECSAVSVKDGTKILMICRTTMTSSARPEPHPLLDRPMERFAHTSEDCGKTWSKPLVLPMSGLTCHGTLCNVRGRLLFSIPLGAETAPSQWGKHLDQRYKGAVYISDDEGETWRHKIVEPGSFSYSTIGPLTSDSSMVMYASGSMGQEGVFCRVLPDEWLGR